MTVKLVAIGDEVGIILPDAALQHLGVGNGDWVCVEETRDALHLRRCNSEFVEQMEAVERVMKDNQSVLHRLQD